MYKRSRTTSVPVAKSSSVNYQAANRSVTFTGREYIDKVVSPDAFGTFSTTSRLLRATDYTIFSWLATIASRFEEFKFNSFTLVYEPQCSSSNTGNVCLWFDGDPTHAAPGSWNQMVNTGANAHGAPWSPLRLNVPRQLLQRAGGYFQTREEFGDANPKTNNLSYSSVVDPMEYYPGIFGFGSIDIGLNGTPAAGSVGKVYLEYSVTLKTQNVEGWTKASTPSATLRSAEEAFNSGYGYVAIGNGTFPATGGFLMGGINGTVLPTYNQAGCQYFKSTPDNRLMATQDLSLLVTVFATADNNFTLNTGIQFSVNGTDYSANTAAGNVYKMDYTNVGVPSQQAITIANFKLKAGDYFAIKANFLGALSGWRATFSPWIFKLIDA